MVGLLPVDGFGACSDFVTAPRAFFTRLDLPGSAAATAASTAGNDDAHAAPATTGDPILSHVEAAALLVPGVLAITGLHGHAHIQAGETALVLNADRSEGLLLAVGRGRLGGVILSLACGPLRVVGGTKARFLRFGVLWQAPWQCSWRLPGACA